MSMSVEFSDIVEALCAVGVKRGDIVNVHSRLFTIGLLRHAASPAETPQIYLRALREVLGDDGTIVVPTYTTSFGRLGKPFVYEQSPSEMGLFSEHVRTSPGAVRTLHPVQSLAALGAQARVLTADHPRWNVGYDTIWQRMLERGGQVVVVGIPFRQCLSFVHQVESLACVPYLYHKLLSGEVYAGGRRIDDEFLIAVRYLRRGIAYDLEKLERDLRQRGLVTEVPLGTDRVQRIPMDAVFDTCMDGLRKDSYYLLRSHPGFTRGEIPWDGPTTGREEPVPSYFQVLE